MPTIMSLRGIFANTVKISAVDPLDIQIFEPVRWYVLPPSVDTAFACMHAASLPLCRRTYSDEITTYNMKYIVHGTKNQNDCNFKLTLEQVCQNEWSTFRSASTDLDHELVVCDLTQIPHLHPDPSAGINYLQLCRIMQVKSLLVSFLNYLEKISNMHHDSSL